MKITRRQLRQIINEELQQIIPEVKDSADVDLVDGIEQGTAQLKAAPEGAVIVGPSGSPILKKEGGVWVSASKSSTGLGLKKTNMTAWRRWHPQGGKLRLPPKTTDAVASKSGDEFLPGYRDVTAGGLHQL